MRFWSASTIPPPLSLPLCACVCVCVCVCVRACVHAFLNPAFALPQVGQVDGGGAVGVCIVDEQHSDRALRLRLRVDL